MKAGGNVGGLDIIIYMVYIVHENTETAVGSENHLLKLKGKTKKNKTLGLHCRWKH